MTNLASMRRFAFVLILALIARPAFAAHYASLRSDKVYLREGPTYQHRVLFIYKRKDYPVEVIASYESWRRVRDVDGTVGWISQMMLSDARSRAHHRQGPCGNPLAALRSGFLAGLGRPRRCRKAQGMQASILRDRRRWNSRLDRQNQNMGSGRG